MCRALAGDLGLIDEIVQRHARLGGSDILADLRNDILADLRNDFVACWDFSIDPRPGPVVGPILPPPPANAVFAKVNRLLFEAGNAHCIKDGVVAVQAVLSSVGYVDTATCWKDEISKWGVPYLGNFDPATLQTLVTDRSKPKAVIEFTTIEDVLAADALFALWKREGVSMQPWFAFTRVGFNPRGGHRSPATTVTFIAQILVSFVTQPRGGSVILNDLRQDIAHVYSQAAQGSLELAADIQQQAATIAADPMLQEAQVPAVLQANAQTHMEAYRRHRLLNTHPAPQLIRGPQMYICGSENDDDLVKCGISDDPNRRWNDRDERQRGYVPRYQIVLKKLDADPEEERKKLQALEMRHKRFARQFNVHKNPSGEEMSIRKYGELIGVDLPHSYAAACHMAAQLVQWNRRQVAMILEVFPASDETRRFSSVVVATNKAEIDAFVSAYPLSPLAAQFYGGRLVEPRDGGGPVEGPADDPVDEDEVALAFPMVSGKRKRDENELELQKLRITEETKRAKEEEETKRAKIAALVETLKLTEDKDMREKFMEAISKM
jgi:hypothetical protein